MTSRPNEKGHIMRAPDPDWIAKDCLDIGLYSNRLEEMLAFWQTEIGLAFDHMLPVGGGVRQHRHNFEGAVLKLNHTRDPLAPASDGGLQRLIIAKDDVTDAQDLVDPDGNQIRLISKGEDGIEHWAIEIATDTAESFLAHYENALGLPRDDRHPLAVRCGRSLIIGVERPGIAHASDGDQLQRQGFRYTTIQVFQVDTLHRRALSAGAMEGMAPQTLGKTARISFLNDRHGNWMELSQRASITGSLEPN